jgi:hypothetical protein
MNNLACLGLSVCTISYFLVLTSVPIMTLHIFTTHFEGLGLFLVFLNLLIKCGCLGGQFRYQLGFLRH